VTEPTRDRLLRHLVEAAGPVPMASLTDAVGLNHTTVREHVAKLVAAGLVAEAREPSTNRRGRPRVLYRATPEAYRVVDGDRPYALLVDLLVDALASRDDPIEVGRRAGAALPPGASPAPSLVSALARQGFDPRAAGDGREIVLGHCPYAHAAARAPEIVCRLHLGVAQGMADAIGGATVVDLVARDPRQAGCRVLVEPSAPGAH
jgi:predicted ArsR family transcriptional regulator